MERLMGRPRRTVETAAYKNLMVRIPTELLESFKARAAAERRSLNGQLLCVIEAWLKDEAARAREPAVSHAAE